MKVTLAILMAMAVLLLGACGTPVPVPTPTPQVLADCFLSFHLAAWQDLDGDGLWGASEPPLAGVEFPVSGQPGWGSFGQIWGEPYLTGVDGRLTITTWSPDGCLERDLTITAVPLESYEPTTPDSVTFSLTSTDFSYEAQFGFRLASR